jgi:hypothetical protein
LDVLCCIRSGQPPKEPLNFWKKKFSGPYFNLLQKNACIFSVIIISIGLLILAGFGMAGVPVGLS